MPTGKTVLIGVQYNLVRRGGTRDPECTRCDRVA